MESETEETPDPGTLERVIAARVRDYRGERGLSSAELASLSGISKAMVSRIESATTSASLTTLGRIAGGLGVPVTALFRGADADREAVFTREGGGSVTVRGGTRLGHVYRQLGVLKDVDAALDPTLVSLTESSAVFPLFQHGGTEFLFMLEGEMVYAHGEQTFRLRPGDSLLIDGEAPHGPQELVAVPIRFLAVRSATRSPTR
ncbi:helix-turn-helix domain-containing protein [uncultured Amnibacterium sp.]|uniref:helix-turn-helix domain-containing protein n=1 Tax=uncultured Amnibacterium sp. TaxID=1631851 RepID=UPI0035CC7647